MYETCYMNKLAFTFQSTSSHGNDLLEYEYKVWTQFIFGIRFLILSLSVSIHKAQQRRYLRVTIPTSKLKSQSLHVDARVEVELMRCYISSSSDISTLCKQAADTK